MDLLSISIGLGLAVSLLFSELLGLATGGMIVPGYMALHINKPLEILTTLAAAFSTYIIVRLLSSVMIVYGRRRTVLMVITGYMIGYLFKVIQGAQLIKTNHLDINTIGYIIPGLIAIWYDRQGVIETTTSLLMASVLVRLLLVLFLGNELL